MRMYNLGGGGDMQINGRLFLKKRKIPSKSNIKTLEITKDYAVEKFEKSKFNQLKVA